MMYRGKVNRHTCSLSTPTAAQESIEQTSGDDKYPATKQTEEVAGQRDTKSADAADSADSMIV
jgi:hypothetical protein